jgi:GNAT superfamily N-acetyltransferase
MGVTERAQGRQVGRKLAEAAIAKAREQGARSIVLESSTKLGPALQLYKSLGFRNSPRKAPSKFVRTDVFMKLEIGNGK